VGKGDGNLGAALPRKGKGYRGHLDGAKSPVSLQLFESSMRTLLAEASRDGLLDIEVSRANNGVPQPLTVVTTMNSSARETNSGQTKTPNGNAKQCPAKGYRSRIFLASLRATTSSLPVSTGRRCETGEGLWQQ
jgi:hypothetical protein